MRRVPAGHRSPTEARTRARTGETRGCKTPSGARGEPNCPCARMCVCMCVCVCVWVCVRAHACVEGKERLVIMCVRLTECTIPQSPRASHVRSCTHRRVACWIVIKPLLVQCKAQLGISILNTSTSTTTTTAACCCCRRQCLKRLHGDALCDLRRERGPPHSRSVCADDLCEGRGGRWIRAQGDKERTQEDAVCVAVVEQVDVVHGTVLKRCPRFALLLMPPPLPPANESKGQKNGGGHRSERV